MKNTKEMVLDPVSLATGKLNVGTPLAARVFSHAFPSVLTTWGEVWVGTTPDPTGLSLFLNVQWRNVLSHSR
jgi:hypothetical protein